MRPVIVNSVHYLGNDLPRCVPHIGILLKSVKIYMIVINLRSKCPVICIINH